MMIMHIKGATRVLGLSQGYQGLPVKDEFIQAEGEGKIPVMLTAKARAFICEFLVRVILLFLWTLVPYLRKVEHGT